ncbi:hypothetical protein [Texcoconibacillus texcoconensis]|uniref:ABC-type antimicrobial peptide transport system permease subunit n=1 Tax=Texcoconibacillus texcoconensis TaxID=1095777 RepID=A0A840QMD0_9BACI|nr:hypothetical protein [Texcoconibacillus texcoconensis]MBB5172534.1 ABC-type antimicrobial peptide transport system permease subunit [Texcoconibacillus texcoconensis]
MLFQRFLYACVTTVMFSAIVAGFVYEPASRLPEGATHMSFGLLLGIYMFYSAPVIFLVGIPVSWLLDKLMLRLPIRSTMKWYATYLGLYAGAGLSVMLIYVVGRAINVGMSFVEFSNEALISSLAGLTAALLYYGVMVALQGTKERWMMTT